jgi:hypothetical protein
MADFMLPPAFHRKPELNSASLKDMAAVTLSALLDASSFGSNLAVSASNLAAAASNRAFSVTGGGGGGAAVTVDPADPLVVSTGYTMSALSNKGAAGAAVSRCFAASNVKLSRGVVQSPSGAYALTNSVVYAGAFNVKGDVAYTFSTPSLVVASHFANTADSMLMSGFVAVTADTPLAPVDGAPEQVVQPAVQVVADNASMYFVGGYVESENPRVVSLTSAGVVAASTTRLKAGGTNAAVYGDSVFLIKAPVAGGAATCGVTINCDPIVPADPGVDEWGDPNPDPDPEPPHWATASGVAFDSSGNMYVGGSYTGAPKVHLDGVFTGHVLRDAGRVPAGFVLKLSSTGTPVASATVQGTGSSSVLSLAADSAGNVYASGANIGDLLVYTGAASTTPARSSAGYANYLIKFTTSLAPSWISNVSSVSNMSLAADASGVYVGGQAASASALYNTGNTQSAVAFPKPAGAFPCWMLAKWSSAGTVLWVDQVDQATTAFLQQIYGRPGTGFNGASSPVSVSGDRVCMFGTIPLMVPISKLQLSTSTGAGAYALPSPPTRLSLTVSATTGVLAHSIKLTYADGWGAAVGPSYAFAYGTGDTAIYDSSGLPSSPNMQTSMSSTSTAYAASAYAGRSLLARYSLTTAVPPIYALLSTPAPTGGAGFAKTLVNMSASPAYVNLTTDASAPQTFGDRATSTITLPAYGSKLLSWYNDRWYN